MTAVESTAEERYLLKRWPRLEDIQPIIPNYAKLNLENGINQHSTRLPVP